MSRNDLHGNGQTENAYDATKFLGGGSYVTKDTLAGGPKRFTITGVSTHRFDGDGTNVLQLGLDENLKFTLNKTNLATLIEAFGKDTTRWVGQQVVLYVNPDVSYHGKMLGGVRIRADVAATAPSRAAGIEEAMGDGSVV